MTSGLDWPYPQVPARKLGGPGLALGIGMLVGGLVCAVLAAAFTPMAFHMLAASKRSGASGLVVGIVPLLAATIGGAGIVSLRSALDQRKRAEALVRNGVGCWGRIRTMAPRSAVRRVGALRWTELEIVVDAFVAAGQTNTALRPGMCLAEKVVVRGFVSDAQVSLAQPEKLVAVLVNPRDTTQVHLDGFAREDGSFVAVT